MGHALKSHWCDDHRHAQLAAEKLYVLFARGDINEHPRSERDLVVTLPILPERDAVPRGAGIIIKCLLFEAKPGRLLIFEDINRFRP